MIVLLAYFTQICKIDQQQKIAKGTSKAFHKKVVIIIFLPKIRMPKCILKIELPIIDVYYFLSVFFDKLFKENKSCLHRRKSSEKHFYIFKIWEILKTKQA